MCEITSTEFQQRVLRLMHDYCMSYDGAVLHVEKDLREEKLMMENFCNAKQGLKDKIKKREMAERADRILNNKE